MKKIINFLGYIIIGGLLFVISFVNIEKIINLDFSNIYVILFFLYFILGIIGFFISRKYKELNYIFKFILFFSILLLPGFFINHHFLLEHITENDLYLRVYGKLAFLYMSMALIISPIVSFIKNTNLSDNLIFSRKVLGIISAIFFLKHGLEYFSFEYVFQTKYNLYTPYLDYVIKNLLIRYDALSGVVAGILMIILGVTSNKFFQKFLGGKKWKIIQKLVFPAFLISAIHIAISSRFETFYIFLISLVVLLRLAAYINKKEKNKSGKIIGYRCIPCGYIYNEAEGDTDSGIAPGTRFEDIPDTWYCPVCVVGKEYFEAIYEGEEEVLESEIVGYEMLTDNVLELKIKLEKNQKVLPGQFANFIYEDIEGEFRRSYSIVHYENNILTFGIKLKEVGTGRGSDILRKSNIGDKMKFGGMFGKFVLQNTKNPKVFIATGTGLSPIINMIEHLKNNENNILLFGVQKKKDLFYLDKFKNIKTYIYLSRQETEKYNFGRIDLSKYNFEKNTEFYICGNPALVKSNRELLEKSGFKNVYSEEF